MRVALLGTGIMGSGMAANLVDDHDVVVWNRTRAKAEAIDGVEVAATPAEAADGADLLVTMLFDADATRDAVAGQDGALAAGAPPAVWVQTATVGDSWRDLAALVEGNDVTFLDAPVLGTKGPAQSGQLVQLLAGPADARDRAQPAIDCWSSRTVVTGDEPGSASRMKLAVNATLALLNGAAAEALTLAERLGVDPRTLLSTLEGGAVWAPVMSVKGTMMLDDDLEAHFPLEGLHKDVRLARAAAGLGEDELPSLAGVLAALQRGVDGGDGSRDMAAVHRWV